MSILAPLYGRCTHTHTRYDTECLWNKRKLDDCTIFMTYKNLCVVLKAKRSHVFALFLLSIIFRCFFFFWFHWIIFQRKWWSLIGREIWVATVVFCCWCCSIFVSSKSIWISAFSAPDTSHKLISDLQKKK